MVGHCWDSCCWAMLGCSAFGTSEILCGWILQGCSAVGTCRDTLQLGMEEMRLRTVALPGYSAVRHRAEGKENIHCFKSKNPTNPKP